MTKYLVAYFSTVIVLCALDFLWLSQVATGFYQSQVGTLMLARPRMGIAVMFYLLYVVGIAVFAVLPGIEADNWIKTALLGALLGLIAYGTYDLTNLATLKGWTLAISLVDIGWGMVVSAAAGSAGFFATRWALRIAG